MPDTDTPTLADAILGAVQGALDNVRVGLPGVVKDYDSATQTATVQPALTRADGSDLPDIPNVPVAFPQSGSYAITWPLEPGDPVWMWFGERSIEGWLATGTVAPAADTRKFDWSDAVAYPGATPRPDAVETADPDNMVLGRRDGSALIDLGLDNVLVDATTLIKLGDAAASLVALATLANSNWGVLVNLLTTWTVAAGDGGLALKTAALALAGGGWPQDVACTKVKAE